MLALILTYIIIFTYLAWRRLDWAVMLIIFALWSYLIRFSIIGIPTTLLEAMILIVFVVWVLKYGKQVAKQAKQNLQARHIRRRYPFDWEMVAVLIVSLVAVVVAGFTDTALGVWKAYFFEPILFFLVVFNVLGNDRRYDKIVYPLSISAIVLSLVAIYQKLTGSFVVPEFWTETAQRATSVFSYPNALGLYLAPIVLLLVGWVSYQIIQRKNNRQERKENDEKYSFLGIIISLMTIMLSLIAIVLAQSDGALVGIVVGLIFFGILANRRLALATIAILIVGVVMIFSQPVLKQRVIDKVTFFDLSGQIRTQQWQETWQMLGDGHWLLGSGLSNYQNVVSPYHQEGIFVKTHDPQWLDKVLYDEEYHKQAWQPVEIYLYPHNILFNFWTELGLVGVLLFMWLIGKYLVWGVKNILTNRQANRYLTLGLTSAMVVIVVHGLVDVPYFKNDLAMIFWLLFSMLGMIYVRSKTKKTI